MNPAGQRPPFTESGPEPVFTRRRHFARQTVDDWLAVLADAQAPVRRRGDAGTADRALALAVLRGALLDLLATGDTERTTAAVERYLRFSADLN